MSTIDIKTNLEAVKERIKQACQRARRATESVTLIAVSKTVEADTITCAYNLGIRDFGENRVQEAGKKIERLSDLRPQPTWHMIGHLQSNKVKTTLEHFDIIHSVDSIELAEAINQRSQKRMPILLQVNIADESTKSGFSLDEINPAFEAISNLNKIEIRGLMTIAPLTEDPEKVRPIFRKLRELRDGFHLQHLSMGMTDDFEVAIEEGSTMVRIGRAIFGERS